MYIVLLQRSSGACPAAHLCVVGIACYGSSAVTAQLSEQCVECVRRTASQRGRGLTAFVPDLASLLPADSGR